ncbi:hypothetical protein C4K04_3027 [Pseudomonas chlororaphis]|uniref:Uncharacterized protein n=1 Tax=Pseudomonas chlororaphis TaxID=587753 RepID=A0A3G7TR07_9PSED|nr:hypothetical protein C4K04_3027 [Pseudomonas chlororaphis]
MERPTFSTESAEMSHNVCMKLHEPGDDFWIYIKRVGFQQFEVGY